MAEAADAARRRLPRRYELRFHIGAYFTARGIAPQPPFLDVVAVNVGLADGAGHYHVPLLCTPWSYTTYRGRDGAPARVWPGARRDQAALRALIVRRSAICTAFRAAPFSSWSPHRKKSSPRSPNTGLARMRPASTSSWPVALIGIG